MNLTRPKWLSHERIAFTGCLAAALLFLWQAVDLEMWTIVGPGPGLFPSIAAGICAVLAGLLALFPALGDDSRTSVVESEPEPQTPMDSGERRIFLAYCLVLPFLYVGSLYLGFFLLAVVVVMTLTWWAEGRDWRSALAFGVACGVVGVIGFNHFLSTSIPLSALDQTLLRLVR
jgi:hypothetical protein